MSPARRRSPRARGTRCRVRLQRRRRAGTRPPGTSRRGATRCRGVARARHAANRADRDVPRVHDVVGAHRACCRRNPPPAPVSPRAPALRPSQNAPKRMANLMTPCVSYVSVMMINTSDVVNHARHTAVVECVRWRAAKCWSKSTRCMHRIKLTSMATRQLVTCRHCNEKKKKRSKKKKNVFLSARQRARASRRCECVCHTPN